MLLPLLLLTHLAAAPPDAPPDVRPRRACARWLVAPGRPMPADRVRLRSKIGVAAFVRAAVTEEFQLDARVGNVRERIDHQGRVQNVGDLGRATVFLKAYAPWDAEVRVAGQLVSRLRREAVFLKILDDLRLGPRFFGVTRLNGRPALVTEYVPDAIFHKKNRPSLRRPRADLKMIVQRQLEHAVLTLHRYDILPYDLQILVSEHGRVVVIDPELFQLYDEEESRMRTPHTWFTEEALWHMFSRGGT